ncbi:DEAD/DEAH box helicase [Nocardioides KLBMP 9356]|uniref:DEAD/DEAH box helicase n=1 Tax=Nocardioides potassii TaxID=2911371 RepID=A0ABS9H879_9ACTN|nr:helicase-related protein [Nocardioides potassii]MCF6376426.1 DEAD/DEAH box helicase [Nocardioides potassii]
MDDVAYTPAVDGRWTDLGGELEQWLVLGEPTEEIAQAAEASGASLRFADGTMWSRSLHTGTYTLRRGSKAAIVLVLHGIPGGSALQGDSRRLVGHMGLAEPVFESMWPQGRAVDTSAGVREGDVVRLRGSAALGTVTAVRLRAGEYEVEVRGPNGVQVMDTDALEVIGGDPNDPAFWISQPGGSAADISLTVTWTKLRNALTDTVYSYASSKTIFRPYQFVPVLKLLSSGTGRLLIADEVGLGKTIEAGLIWSELERRTPLDRVLVVCPASLRLKWKSEMGRRFDRDLALMTPQDLRDQAHKMAQGRESRFAGVVGVESLRRHEDALQALTDVHARFDLVIVDEAHVLRNRGGKSYQLGQLLSDWADVLVFLSATPLNLGQSDLFNLVNMLHEEEFSDPAVFEAQLEPNEALNEVIREVRTGMQAPRTLLPLVEGIAEMELGAAVAARPDYGRLCTILDVDRPLTSEEAAGAKRAASALNTLGSVLTRTRKADVPDAKAIRVAEQVPVDWSDHERSMYESVRALYTAEAERRGTPIGFALQMPLRQAASCLPAMQESIRRRFVDAEDEDEDAFEDVADAAASDRVELDILDLDGLMRPLAHDTKFEAMLERLLQARERGMQQAMVFSFFTGTLRYLEERLSQHFSARRMTGATSMDDRQSIMQEFRDGKFELLLLSQVGAEGLDFEFCNVMVNYDLPWNPMQVEQRIGRLDRFGQQNEKIFILNMHVPGTIESDIFERLYRRIGVFERSIGELEPILRDKLKDITRSLLDPSLTPAERDRESKRVAVALAERAAQVRELEASRGALSTVDQLQVDGMTDDGPTHGRFVGAAEVRLLVERLVARLGGKLTPSSQLGISRLTGSVEMATRLRALDVRSSGGMRPVGQLAADLANRAEVRVTFDSDVASKHGVELVASRHPLVDLALASLEDDVISLRRFAVVGLPGAQLPALGALVRLDMVSSTGVRPRTELWAHAVDLDTGETLRDLGPELLESIARGSLVDVPHEQHPLVEARLTLLDEIAAVRRRGVQRERRADNDALVDARLASQQRSIDIKMDRARSTLADVRERERDDRVARLHEGRIKNLELDRARVEHDLEAMRHLDVTSSTVAVLQVHRA